MKIGLNRIDLPQWAGKENIIVPNQKSLPHEIQYIVVVIPGGAKKERIIPVSRSFSSVSSVSVRP